ncbi:MAG: hypothetical protein N2747_04995 [Chitinophagaceae bacterium]|nr:hypothetical protein [Chitinophagaceae bacterium]
MRGVTLYFLLFLFFAVSCKKTSRPNNENEHEAINKVEFVFYQNGNLYRKFILEDPDGDGGAPPTRIDSIILQRASNYTAELFIKNISGGVEKDITALIRQQGTSHEFFYIPSGVNVTITKNDKDANNFPLGLNTTWTTGPAGQGSLLLKLMHKTGIKGPNDSPDKGHADIQINIPLKIL